MQHVVGGYRDDLRSVFLSYSSNVELLTVGASATIACRMSILLVQCIVLRLSTVAGRLSNITLRPEATGGQYGLRLHYCGIRGKYMLLYGIHDMCVHDEYIIASHSCTVLRNSSHVDAFSSKICLVNVSTLAGPAD